MALFTSDFQGTLSTFFQDEVTATASAEPVTAALSFLHRRGAAGPRGADTRRCVSAAGRRREGAVFGWEGPWRRRCFRMVWVGWVS